MRNKKSEIQMGCKTIVVAAFVAISMVFGATSGEVVATAVTAQQRYPWNGKVDIAVTISGASNDAAQAICTFTATNSATQTALDVAHITGVEGVVGNESMWTRRFVWDAAADIGEVKIEDVVLTVETGSPFGGVQLWEGGPYWAECNVGAKKPEECGYSFWWGDTVGYTRSGGKWNSDWAMYEGVTWVSSAGVRMSGSPFSSSGCPTYGKNKSQLQSAGYIDSTGNLVAAHDAATTHLGAPWRMPTSQDIGDLISKCDTTWTTRNGVKG